MQYPPIIAVCVIFYPPFVLFHPLVLLSTVVYSCTVRSWPVADREHKCREFTELEIKITEIIICKDGSERFGLVAADIRRIYLILLSNFRKWNVYEHVK